MLSRGRKVESLVWAKLRGDRGENPFPVHMHG
jgi:hypothetical protein